ncbi:MAG: twin-arginine translocase subunit TatC [Syntrophobacterales bacterium]|jgi:hypothetical protein|nr:twin-arginine translocase subunit TatC [Syntrophobacterales bacterium]
MSAGPAERRYVAVTVTFVFTYYFKGKVLDILMRPFVMLMYDKSAFIFTGITEAFIAYFKILIVMTLFLGAPVIFYKFWMFAAHGIHEKEVRHIGHFHSQRYDYPSGLTSQIIMVVPLWDSFMNSAFLQPWFWGKKEII